MKFINWQPSVNLFITAGNYLYYFRMQAVNVLTNHFGSMTSMKQNRDDTLCCTHELVPFSKEDACSKCNRPLQNFLWMLFSEAIHRCIQNCEKNWNLSSQLVQHFLPAKFFQFARRCVSKNRCEATCGGA